MRKSTTTTTSLSIEPTEIGTMDKSWTEIRIYFAATKQTNLCSPMLTRADDENARDYRAQLVVDGSDANNHHDSCSHHLGDGEVIRAVALYDVNRYIRRLVPFRRPDIPQPTD